MKGYKRRTFLSTVATSSLLAGAASAKATASNAVFLGQLVDHRGDPVAHRRLTLASRSSGHHEITTDGDGRFEQEVSSNTTYRFGFYRYKYGPQPKQPNGVPHVCSLGRHTAEDGETDLGRLSIDKAHLVEVQALDSDGNPMGGVSGDLYAKGEDGDYWGTGPSTLSTNHEGYIVVDDGAYTGMELAAAVEFSISLPNGNGGNIEYSREFFVEEPLSITAKVGEGMTITPAGEKSTSTEEPTTEATTTEREETTSTTERTTTERTTTPMETTKTTTTAETGGPESTETQSNSSETGPEPSRGFLSNGTGNEFEMLNDPFVLTVGGFVLSAGGIVHQLLRGR